MAGNYYDILKVSRNAGKEEIRLAFRTLAKKYHPDVNPDKRNAAAMFRQIQEAYSVLSDEEKRKKYDLKLAYGSFYQQTPGNKKTTRPSKPRNPFPNHRFTKKKSKPVFIIPVWFSLLMILLITLMIGGRVSQQNKMLSVNEENPEEKTQTERLSEVKPGNAPLQPYDDYFGPNNLSGLNKLVIINSDQTEAVVVLVEEAKNEVAGHFHFNKGEIFAFENVPDGDYFTKILFGNNWINDTLIHPEGNVKGFFRDNVFLCRFPSNGVISLRSGSDSTFTNYRMSIDPRLAGGVNTLSVEAFFRL